MTEKWIQGEVISVKHWTESLYSIRINAPDVNFIAGQYTKISLTIDNEDLYDIDYHVWPCSSFG